MSDEIAQLQAELAAAAAAADVKKSDALHFSKKSPECKLVTATISGHIETMDRLRRENVPFAERTEHATNVYKYIMANPNVFAATVALRNSCIAKAHEFMECDFNGYQMQQGFSVARERLRYCMQNFIEWTVEILPLNVHYNK